LQHLNDAKPNLIPVLPKILRDGADTNRHHNEDKHPDSQQRLRDAPPEWCLPAVPFSANDVIPQNRLGSLLDGPPLRIDRIGMPKNRQKEDVLFEWIETDAAIKAVPEGDTLTDILELAAP